MKRRLTRRVRIFADLDDKAKAAGWTTATVSEGVRRYEITVAADTLAQTTKYVTVYVGPRGAIKARMRTFTFGPGWAIEIAGRVAWSLVGDWLGSP